MKKNMKEKNKFPFWSSHAIEMLVAEGWMEVLTQTRDDAKANHTVSVGLWGLPRPLEKTSALIRWLYLQNSNMGKLFG